MSTSGHVFECCRHHRYFRMRMLHMQRVIYSTAVLGNLEQSWFTCPNNTADDCTSRCGPCLTISGRGSLQILDASSLVTLACSEQVPQPFEDI